MLIVAGLNLKNLKPRVWDPASPHYLPELQAVMLSYADFHASPARRAQAMEQGLRSWLGVPPGVRIYLDNGAFAFLRSGLETPRDEYQAFVAGAKPDWYPIPQDYIPTPAMASIERNRCFRKTMEMNREYGTNGSVPVVHAGPLLPRYLRALQRLGDLAGRPNVALGGMVPNLLRAPKAVPYADLLDDLRRTRAAFVEKNLHVFGLGGTATLHLAALFGMDSLDSCGWRNRAARGMIQLPGSGERSIVKMGNWRGREPSAEEWLRLAQCPCPACRASGLAGLKASGLEGFCLRATHNLWVLIREGNEVHRRLDDGSYATWFEAHLDNSTYLPLIKAAARVGDG